MQFPDGSFFGSGSTESILYMLQAGNIENVTGFLLCNQMIYELKNTLQKMNVILNL